MHSWFSGNGSTFNPSIGICTHEVLLQVMVFSIQHKIFVYWNYIYKHSNYKSTLILVKIYIALSICVNRPSHFAIESLIIKCAKILYRPSPTQYANFLCEIWTWCILRNVFMLPLFIRQPAQLSVLNFLKFWMYGHICSKWIEESVETHFCFLFR
jgi:hypothetical protein